MTTAASRFVARAPGASAMVAAALTALALLAPTAGAAQHGALRLLSGPGACLGTGSGCARLRGPAGIDRIAISPDGLNVYLTGQAGGLAVLRRTPSSGRLRQLAGAAGCLRRDGGDRCARVAAASELGGASVSPDGRYVYLATLRGLVTLRRDPASGSLRQAARTRIRGVRAPSVVLATAGGALLVAGGAPPGAAGGGVAILARNAATGAVRQPAGKAGCLTTHGSSGCATAPCIGALNTLAASSDGTTFYVGTTNSLNPELTDPGAVLTLRRATGTAALSASACATRPEAVSAVAIEPGAGSLFVSTLYGNRGEGRTSATVDRYLSYGMSATVPAGRLACVSSSGCTIPLDPDGTELAVAPDGQTLYASVFFGGLAPLRIGARGASLSPFAGQDRCLVAARAYQPPGSCRRAGEQIGGPLAISPDGRDLYAATLGNGSGSLYAGGIETFALSR